MRGHIEGTGFLVRETTVITNRHVVEALLHQQRRRRLERNQMVVLFVYPADEGWVTSYQVIQGFGAVQGPLDVGFLEFRRDPDDRRFAVACLLG